MQPYLEKRKTGRVVQTYAALGGQVMSFIWVALVMSFVIALMKAEALLGFAGCITGLAGALAYRAVGEDRHLRAKLLEGEQHNGH